MWSRSATTMECCMIKYRSIVSSGFRSRLLSGLRLDNRGSVLVEASIFLPMLVFLAIGTFEFGRLYQHHHVLVKAVRDAGRFLARVPALCPGGSIAVANDETTAKNLALTGEPSGGTPRLNYWTSPSTVNVTVDCFDNTANTFAAGQYIPLVTVTATVPYSDVGFLSILGLDPITFQVAHQEVNVGE
jgi:Flp pilus assembly protein TadG